MSNKIEKRVLCFILITVLLLIAFLIFLFVTKEKENVLKTYSANEYGLMRDEECISDEIFDEYGNLIHYNYKQKIEGSTIEKEYKIKYTFDEKNRITKVEYDNNYIDIEYNNQNKIYKLINRIKEDTLEKKYEFNFIYEDTITKVNSVKSFIYSDEAENYTIVEEYILTENIIDNEKYSICTISENNLVKQKYIYRILDKEVNYSNIFSLLNINFEGYVSFLPSIKNSNFTIEIPIFNSENIVSLEDLSNNTNINFSYNNYYDNNNNILKCDMSLKSDIYYMYKFINDKEYYGYSLEMGNYTYIKYKDYLNDSGIYKREIIEEKILAEEVTKMLTKFNEYFELNKE